MSEQTTYIIVEKVNGLQVKITPQQYQDLQKGKQVRGVDPNDESNYIFIMPHIETYNVVYDNERMNVIGQNGNDGLHYEQ